MSPKKTDPEETEQPARRSRATASAEPAAVAAAPDRTLYWAVAVLGAIVFFGAGYLVGQEVDDHSDFDGQHGRGMIIVRGGNDFPRAFPPFSEQPGIPDDREGRGFLGVAGMDTPGGVRILEVVPGGPADEAGVEAGDRVVAFDGVEISSMEQLADLVGATEPGTEAELVLGGPDGGRTVTVTIGERP